MRDKECVTRDTGDKVKPRENEYTQRALNHVTRKVRMHGFPVHEEGAYWGI